MTIRHQQVAPSRPSRAPRLVMCCTFLVAVSGCATKTPGLGIADAGLSCINDTPHCIDRRQAALRALLSDPQRTWVHRTPSANAYASGVRMFAYKKSKKSLTCPELNVGIREGENARAVLRGAASRLTPAQVARGAMLGDEVASELKREKQRRCKNA